MFVSQKSINFTGVVNKFYHAATLDPNTMIECRTDRSCGGSPVTSTMKGCCDNDIEPSGLAYTVPGVEGCHLCRVGKIVFYRDLHFKCNPFYLKVVTSGITQYLARHVHKFYNECYIS